MTHLPPLALVTGATGGMGQEIVRELARTHRVIAVGRNEPVLDALAAETGCLARVADLTDETALEDLVAGLTHLHVVVHAAAIAEARTVEQATAADWHAQFAINVTAPALLTRLALPLLRETQGTVIFIGSGASTHGAKGNAVYAASKHALKGLADSLRLEERDNFVRVATIAPGPTDTQMLRGLIEDSAYVPEHYVRPASVAQAVRFVVDAPADVHITDLAVRPRQELRK